MKFDKLKNILRLSVDYKLNGKCICCYNIVKIKECNDVKNAGFSILWTISNHRSLVCLPWVTRKAAMEGHACRVNNLTPLELFRLEVISRMVSIGGNKPPRYNFYYSHDN